MTKFKLIYLGITILTLSMVGCQDKTNKKEEVKSVDTSYICPIINNIPKDEIDNTVIAKRYEDVIKENLTYEVKQNSYYFYESENELVSSLALDEIPNVDDKIYSRRLYVCI